MIHGPVDPAWLGDSWSRGENRIYCLTPLRWHGAGSTEGSRCPDGDRGGPNWVILARRRRSHPHDLRDGARTMTDHGQGAERETDGWNGIEAWLPGDR